MRWATGLTAVSGRFRSKTPTKRWCSRSRAASKPHRTCSSSPNTTSSLRSNRYATHHTSPHLSLHSISLHLTEPCPERGMLCDAGGWWVMVLVVARLGLCCADQLSDESDPASSGQMRLEFRLSDFYRCYVPHLQSMPAHMYQEVMRLPLRPLRQAFSAAPAAPAPAPAASAAAAAPPTPAPTPAPAPAPIAGACGEMD